MWSSTVPELSMMSRTVPNRSGRYQATPPEGVSRASTSSTIGPCRYLAVKVPLPLKSSTGRLPS